MQQQLAQHVLTRHAIRRPAAAIRKPGSFRLHFCLSPCAFTSCTLHSHTPFSHLLHRGRKAIKRHGKPAVQHLLDDLNALVALTAQLGTLFMPSVEGGNECHVGHALDDTASMASG
jgi:hypothetical protein